MVGILTFYWADDYGGMLQAYALKRKLELLGKEVEMIPYAPFKLTGRYWMIPLDAKMTDGGLRYYFSRHKCRRNLLRFRSLCQRRRNMRQFRQEYLTAELPIRNVKKLSLQKYQTVFVGSDQVWNPDITVDVDNAYIGNIPDRGDCRLVSYGASLGGKRFSEDERHKFIRYVGGFDAISLRERVDADYVQGLLNRKVWDVLDPVLLLGCLEWNRVESLPAESGYILVYMTRQNETMINCAKELSVRLGRKIVLLSSFMERDHIWGIKVRNSEGPEGFLGYMKNAAYVLTDSFHGTAFSILMEKHFLTFRHGTQSIRVENLLQKLGLLSHLSETNLSSSVLEIWAATNWKDIRARLTAEREKSNGFLLEQLGDISI